MILSTRTRTRGAHQSRVQVRGCGCCLPIPLGVLTLGALALRGAHARMGSR